jgi:hypothetical protein
MRHARLRGKVEVEVDALGVWLEESCAVVLTVGKLAKTH